MSVPKEVLTELAAAAEEYQAWINSRKEGEVRGNFNLDRLIKAIGVHQQALGRACAPFTSRMIDEGWELVKPGGGRVLQACANARVYEREDGRGYIIDMGDARELAQAIQDWRTGDWQSKKGD